VHAPLLPRASSLSTTKSCQISRAAVHAGLAPGRIPSLLPVRALLRARSAAPRACMLCCHTCVCCTAPACVLTLLPPCAGRPSVCNFPNSCLLLHCTRLPRRATPMLSSHHAYTTYSVLFCRVGAGGRLPPGGRWRPRVRKEASHETSRLYPSLPLTLTANLLTPNAECLSGHDQEGKTRISCRRRALARLHHPASPPDCCTCICRGCLSPEP
jgi:hypothetical protein